jgi:hypothetical protein
MTTVIKRFAIVLRDGVRGRSPRATFLFYFTALLLLTPAGLLASRKWGDHTASLFIIGGVVVLVTLAYGLQTVPLKESVLLPLSKPKLAAPHDRLSLRSIYVPLFAAGKHLGIATGIVTCFTAGVFLLIYLFTNFSPFSPPNSENPTNPQTGKWLRTLTATLPALIIIADVFSLRMMGGIRSPKLMRLLLITILVWFFSCFEVHQSEGGDSYSFLVALAYVIAIGVCLTPSRVTPSPRRRRWPR